VWAFRHLLLVVATAVGAQARGAATATAAILASVINPGVTVLAPGVLSGHLEAPTGLPVVGQAMVFILHVANTGGTTVTNLAARLTSDGHAVISAPLPAGVGSLAPGAEASFTWSVTPQESRTLVLVAVASGLTDTGTGSVAVSTVPSSAVLHGITVTGAGDTYVFPSPAHASARIAYLMAEPGSVRIRVYNAAGELVDVLEDTRPAGVQFTDIATSRLAPGVYLYLVQRTYASGVSDRLAVHKFVVAH
jgi:hypothetical protein